MSNVEVVVRFHSQSVHRKYLSNIAMADHINLNSLEECLEKYIPAGELKEVKRIIYGQREE